MEAKPPGPGQTGSGCNTSTAILHYRGLLSGFEQRCLDGFPKRLGILRLRAGLRGFSGSRSWDL